MTLWDRQNEVVDVELPATPADGSTLVCVWKAAGRGPAKKH